MGKGYDIVVVSGGRYAKPDTVRECPMHEGGNECCVSRVRCKYGWGGGIPRRCPLHQKPVTVKVQHCEYGRGPTL